MLSPRGGTSAWCAIGIGFPNVAAVERFRECALTSTTTDAVRGGNGSRSWRYRTGERIPAELAQRPAKRAISNWPRFPTDRSLPKQTRLHVCAGFGWSWRRRQRLGRFVSIIRLNLEHVRLRAIAFDALCDAQALWQPHDMPANDLEASNDCCSDSDVSRSSELTERPPSDFTSNSFSA